MSIDHGAAQEMVRRSGQMGVPVITAGDEVIVGFDRARLARVAAAHAAGPTAEGPRLGLLVKDSAEGVLIGGARPGTPAAHAGFQRGDRLEQVDGQPVRSITDLARLTAPLASRPVEVVVRRGDQSVRLVLRPIGAV